jgi:uncharacterized protein DUF4397
MKNMKKERLVLSGMTIMMFAAGMLASCKKNSNDPQPPAVTKTSNIEAVNAAAKSGEFEVQVGDKKIPNTIKYLNQPDAYTSFTTKNDVTIQITGANNTVVAKGTHTLEDKQNYTLFIYDTLDAGKKVKYVLLKDNFPAVAAGKTNIRFLHLSPDMPAVDIDLFKGRDSVRLISANPYIGGTPDPKTLSARNTVVASGDYLVKVKTKTGTVINTLLTIPSLTLASGKTITLYLRGLKKGSSGNEAGLQLLVHK